MDEPLFDELEEWDEWPFAEVRGAGLLVVANRWLDEFEEALPVDSFAPDDILIIDELGEVVCLTAL